MSSRSGPARAAERGFTLIETMVALSISIVVLLANIYLINTAHKDLARSRTITAATNLATGRFADFRAMRITEINTAAPNNLGGSLFTRWGSDVVAVDGVQFTRTWWVSAIDLQQATPPVADLVGDLVKVRIEVTWPSATSTQKVTMTTFIAGRS